MRLKLKELKAFQKSSVMVGETGIPGPAWSCYDLNAEAPETIIEEIEEAKADGYTDEEIRRFVGLRMGYQNWNDYLDALLCPFGELPLHINKSHEAARVARKRLELGR